MTRILTFMWLIALFLAAAFISNVEAATRFQVKQMVISEAADSNVPVSLALAVAKVESDFNARALSSAGARGVMQIMPETARGEFGVSPKKLWNPKVNIRLGVEFLEQLHEQYDGRWDLALSHYNGGTVKGDKPHKYTRKYIRNVKKWQRVYQEQASLWNDGAQEYTHDDEEGYVVAELREWKQRGRRDEFEDDDFYYEDEEEEFFEEGEQWGEDTRIIIVERGSPRHWDRPSYDRYDRRPPPPSNHRRSGWRPPPRHFR